MSISGFQPGKSTSGYPTCSWRHSHTRVRIVYTDHQTSQNWATSFVSLNTDQQCKIFIFCSAARLIFQFLYLPVA